MALFTYKAIDARGKANLGQVEALNIIDLEMRLKRGYQVLDVMEQHLAKQEFFVANRYTIADIALYAYTHVAETGGFDLRDYPRVNHWLARVQAQPNYIAMEL